MDAQIGRKTWRTLEPIHGAIYFVPEAFEEYQQLGFTERMSGYFPSRAAAMGAVPVEVVQATFYNFDPALVRSSMDGAWEKATPAALVVARYTAADRMIRRIAPDAIDSPDVVEASAILRTAAMAACERLEGRPLFAGNAGLAWPTEPHLVLFHAQTLLREFRGDGHIAALTAQGLTGCEALVTHEAAGEIAPGILQRSRQRSDDDWNGAIESLQSRGWLDASGAFTEKGREGRNWVEERTDELALAPYAAIGDDACDRLRTLVRPFSKLLAAAIGF